MQRDEQREAEIETGSVESALAPFSAPPPVEWDEPELMTVPVQNCAAAQSGKASLSNGERSRLIFASHFGFQIGPDSLSVLTPIHRIEVLIRSWADTPNGVITNRLQLVKPTSGLVEYSKNKIEDCRTWNSQCDFYSRYRGTARDWGFRGKGKNTHSDLKVRLQKRHVVNDNFGLVFGCVNRSGAAGVIRCRVDLIAVTVWWRDDNNVEQHEQQFPHEDWIVHIMPLP